MGGAAWYFSICVLFSLVEIAGEHGFKSMFMCDLHQTRFIKPVDRVFTPVLLPKQTSHPGLWGSIIYFTYWLKCFIYIQKNSTWKKISQPPEPNIRQDLSVNHKTTTTTTTRQKDEGKGKALSERSWNFTEQWLTWVNMNNQRNMSKCYEHPCYLNA